MLDFPLSDEQTKRISALYELEILDTPAEKEFDHIAILAAQLCSCNTAAISFLDLDRCYIKAKVGKDLKEVCALIKTQFLLAEQTLPIQVEDTGLELRSVTQLPLINDDGDILGHLTVANEMPGLLTPEQFNALQMLAMQTLSLLNLRLQLLKMKELQEKAKYKLDRVLPVFKNAVDGVILVGKGDFICQWNASAERIFGYTEEDAIGQSFHHLLIPERKHPAFWEARKKFNPDGALAENARFEFLAKTKDNREIIVALGATIAFIDEERLFVCFISDITTQRNATKALAKQKRFYENILNQIPMEIAVFDAHHKYLFLNPACIKNAKYREFIIGKDDFEYAAFRKQGDEQAIVRRNKFLRAKSSKKVVFWEDQMNDLEGKLLTRIRKLFPVYEDGELTLMIGYGVDITERKKLEEDQNIMMERLTFQNTQLFDFCNIVTHNLRGPLNNIAMLVDFVEDSGDVAEQKELVSKLKPVVTRLNTTFNELVETVQVKQGLEVKSTVVNLEESLNKTLEGLEMEIFKTGALLTVDCSVAPVIYFPEKYVDSIFHNLLSNALKYRSPERRPEIKVWTSWVGNSIMLNVSDNGLGIDLKKHKDDVFRIGQVFHEHVDAKGLGLYMTKSQVELMGCKIDVESEVNKGSTFRIEFKKQRNLLGAKPA